jgi:hypothetical protein
MTSTDIAAVAAVALSSSVIAALITTMLGNRSEVARAREQRRQERLADTYIEVIEMARAMCDRAADIPLDITRAALDPPQDALTDAQRARWRMASARLEAYGSPAMRSAYLFVAGASLNLDLTVSEARKFLAGPRDEAGLDEFLCNVEMSQYYRQDVGRYTSALIELASAELAERKVGHRGRPRLRFGRISRQSKP